MTELSGGTANAPETAIPIQLTEGVPAVDIGTAPSVHEMPPSHADVDLSALTVEGLIKVCPYYAGLAATNPELARTKATEDLGHTREEAKRQEGMSKEEKEDDFWSSMSGWAEKQTKTKEKAAPEEPTRERKSGPANESIPKQHTERDVPKPRFLVEAEHLASQSAYTRVDSGPAVAQIKTQRPPTKVAPVVARHPKALTPNVTTPLPEQLAIAMTRSAVIELGQQDASELDITSPDIIAATPESDAIVNVVTEGLKDAESIDPATITDLDPGTLELASITAQGPDTRSIVNSAAIISESGLSGVEQTPPIVTFERFTEALGLLVSETLPRTLDESTEFSSEYPPLEPPVAVVVSEVADRLTNLDIEQKEAAFPVVRSATESLQTIKRLQNKAATPKEIVAAVEEMREQIVRLFETIGIDYDDRKVEYFIQAMLAPNFAIRNQAFLTPEELAKMGTREVKLADQFAALLSQTTTPDETPASHRLGRIVLFFIRPSLIGVVDPDPLNWTHSLAKLARTI